MRSNPSAYPRASRFDDVSTQLAYYVLAGRIKTKTGQKGEVMNKLRGSAKPG